jgi:hypothetical protein
MLLVVLLNNIRIASIPRTQCVTRRVNILITAVHKMARKNINRKNATISIRYLVC